MRGPSVLLAAILLAGCAGVATDTSSSAPSPPACGDEPPHTMALALGPMHLLSNATSAAGTADLNQGHDAYVGDVQPWLSAPLATGAHVLNASLSIRVQGMGPLLPPEATAPLYVQAGSDAALASADAVGQWSTGASDMGWEGYLSILKGGFDVEAGQRVQLLVTSLIEGVPDPARVVLGNQSVLTLTTVCAPAREFLVAHDLKTPVLLPASQGSFTHTVPPQEGVNRQTVPFDLPNGTSRLRIFLREPHPPKVKGDVDVTLLDATGKTVAVAGSPAPNETLILGPANLAALAPPGHYQVRVDSYSATNYAGTLDIVLEQLESAHSD